MVGSFLPVLHPKQCKHPIITVGVSFPKEKNTSLSCIELEHTTNQVSANKYLV